MLKWMVIRTIEKFLIIVTGLCYNNCDRGAGRITGAVHIGRVGYSFHLVVISFIAP